MHYRREIDGLRALAVIPVILFHAGFQTFSGGFVGVDVFFVISGYLITRIILSEKEAGTFSLVNFWERRARRILPALSLVLLVSIPLAWFSLLPGDMKEFSDSLVAVSVYASNILFWRTSGYFDTSSELRPLLHTWSLAVEEQFYLFFPVALTLAWKRGFRWMFVALALAAIASLAVAQWAALAKPTAAFFLLPTRGWELLTGALVAFGLHHRPYRPHSGALSEFAGVLGLGLVVFSILDFNKQTPFPGVYALVPTLGAALIIVFASKHNLAGKLLGSKLLAGVGLISYSAYLWHQPLFAFARHQGLNMELHGALPFLGLSGATLLFAFTSWKYVESPFRDRRRFRPAQIFKLSAGASLLFIAMGLAGHLSQGFLFRYEVKDRDLAALQRSEAGEYVKARFSSLITKAFDLKDPRKKVLIIGDSYAQDLVNGLYEGGLTSHIQISTRHISVRCGNLFIPSQQIIKLIDSTEVRQCDGKWLFDDAALREQMLIADEIWFASAWKPWQLTSLSQSVEIATTFSGKPVRVFGTKNFGDINIKKLLSLTERERPLAHGVIRAGTLQLNELMKKILPKMVFVDQMELLCGRNARICPLFTADGKLISHDGWHLTASGAKFLGARLATIQWDRLSNGQPR
jgi:peptidoglycan/LPS O-acetylase OafA/YrhL